MELLNTKSPTTKEDLRKLLKERLAALSVERRAQAEERLIQTLLPQLAPYSKILSFSSFKEEIDTTRLNLELLKEGKLCLPRVVGEELWIYQGEQRISPGALEVALIPALGFDSLHHRLGRGRGYYDRFLSPLTHLKRWGLGFSEQLVKEVPILAHDVSLDLLYLL